MRMKKRMLVGADGNAAATIQKVGDIFSYGTQGVSILADTITKISDKKKRRQFEEALASVSLENQKQIQQRLVDARTENERLAILTDALSKFQIGRIYNVSNQAVEQERRKRTNAILIIGIGVVLLGGITYLIVKK